MSYIQREFPGRAHAFFLLHDETGARAEDLWVRVCVFMLNCQFFFDQEQLSSLLNILPIIINGKIS